MEVDPCSLISILASDRLENNKIMMIVRRTEFMPLGHVHSGDSDCGIEMLHEIHQEKRQHPDIATSSDDPRRGGKRGRQGMTASRKEYRDRLQMEPPRAMSSGTSKIREEEESSDSDSEFYNAVSIIHELKDQPNHNIERTNMTKTSNPDPHKDTINDSGFNEEGEFFEPTSGKLEHVITTGDGKNRISLREDTNPTETERDDTPLLSQKEDQKPDAATGTLTTTIIEEIYQK